MKLIRGNVGFLLKLSEIRVTEGQKCQWLENVAQKLCIRF